VPTAYWILKFKKYIKNNDLFLNFIDSEQVIGEFPLMGWVRLGGNPPQKVQPRCGGAGRRGIYKGTS